MMTKKTSASLETPVALQVTVKSTMSMADGLIKAIKEVYQEAELDRDYQVAINSQIVRKLEQEL
jgi:hypothetical protein